MYFSTLDIALLVIFFIIYTITISAISYFRGKRKGIFITKDQHDTTVIDAVLSAAISENQLKERADKLNKEFSIEHYPITNRYYPKYRDWYLKRDYNTGIIEKKEAFLFAYAQNFKTEKEAREFIELAKEHLFKQNVVTINL